MYANRASAEDPNLLTNAAVAGSKLGISVIFVSIYYVPNILASNIAIRLRCVRLTRVESPGEEPLSETEPIYFRPRAAGAHTSGSSKKSMAGPASFVVTSFDRVELSQILRLYGRMVAAGEWRDYTIDFLRDSAVFSVYRRTAETVLYRIEKAPKNSRRQGAYSVIAATGLILKRGPELARVLSVLEKPLRRFDIVGA